MDGRGLKGTYNGNSSTPIPFIPLHSTNSQTSPKDFVCMGLFEGFLSSRAEPIRVHYSVKPFYKLR
jgi:hypothetical protein